MKIVDGELLLQPNLFENADHLFKVLVDETDWRQEQISIYGETMNIPRLTAWYGDENKNYKYSGIQVIALPWTDTLITIRDAVSKFANKKFNSVLLNRYRNGSDSVSWHADDEKELGENPVIGSVSFGATRTFQMKHKRNNQKYSMQLESGSCLIMRGATQHNWLHQIPKTKKPVGERINLTFRNIP